MNQKSLQDWANEIGQVETARKIGVTQGAICRALKSKRNIFIKESNGFVEAFEIKKFPLQRKETPEKAA